MESAKLKGKVMELINPLYEKIKVRGVRKIIVGGIIVTGLKPKELGSSNPRILIYDIPRNIEPHDLAGIIYNQNEDLLGEMLLERFEVNFSPRFTTGRKEEDVTIWVIEVTPDVRTIFRQNDKTRVYVPVIRTHCQILQGRGNNLCPLC